MRTAGSVAVEVYPAFPAWQRRVRAGVTGPEMSRAGQEAGTQVTQGFERGSSRMAGVVAGVARAAGTGLLAIASASSVIGVKTAADAETAQIAFSTMFGSAEKAKAFLADLTEFAAKTPFDMPGLQTAAQSLISIGIDSSKVIPIMTTLGNVTAGMGTGSEGIKRATVALQQMNAAQKISAEDLNQLRDAGIPVYDLLAGATGRSKKELAAMASSGKLGREELEKLMAALETGKGLERFNGMMEAQSQSLTGLWSTLKDTFSQGMATAIQPIIPLLKDGVAGAIALVNAGMPLLQSGLTWLVTTLPPALGRVKTAVQGVFELLANGNYTGALQNTFGWKGDSTAVTRILEIRDAVLGFFDSTRSGDTSPLTGGLTKLKDLARDALATLPAFKPVLDIIGAGFRFAADNVDLLVKAMPVLVALFAAYKAQQAANNLVGRNTIVGFSLQLASTVALTLANRSLEKSLDGVTRSQRTLMVSTQASTATENTSTLTRLRSAAATAAKTIAEKASAAASRAMAGAQAVLNAVMSANPIALVVLALVALGAGLVLAYKKSETFRNIVQRAWAGVQAAAAFAVSWFMNVAWPTITNVFAWIGSKAIWLWRNVISPYFNLILSLWKSVFGWIRNTGWPMMSAALGFISEKASWLWRKISPVFKSIKDGVASVGRGFELAKSVISTAWGKLSDVVSKPITATIKFVAQNFTKPLNNLLDKIPGMPSLPTFGYADGVGQVLPGWTPGRDVHRFVGPAGILDLSGGEGIARPEVVRAMGRKKWDEYNAAARRGGVRGVQAVMGRHSYAGGGIIDWLKGKGSTLASFVTDPGKAFRKVVSFPSGGLFGDLAGGLLEKLLSGLVSKAKTAVSSLLPKGSGGSGMGWRKQVDWVRQAIPGAVITSTVRTGDPLSYHDKGRAIDLVGGPGKSRIFDIIKAAYPVPSIGQLYYSPKGARQVRYGRESNTPPHIFQTHWDHVHWGMHRGGVIPDSSGHTRSRLFDEGGLLMPGVTRAINLTGRPESILADGGAAARGEAPGGRRVYQVTLQVGARELAAVVFDEGGQQLTGGLSSTDGLG